jgi:hypothetical protein
MRPEGITFRHRATYIPCWFALCNHRLLCTPLQDNEHNLIMKPGDMVLYESAKLLHGRPGMFFEMCTTNMCGVLRCLCMLRYGKT